MKKASKTPAGASFATTFVQKIMVYRSNCRIKTFKTPVFLGDFVRQGAWEKN